MSRMTAAQIINVGEYLEPDFEPTSLTVSQLLGILCYHNIDYPTPYTKTKLVQVFNSDVKTRATRFKKERLKKENSVASDDGIKDGITGQLIGKKLREPAPVARRSSRRLSQVPTLDDDSSPTRTELPKRRRSSAQPALGSATAKKKAVPSQFTVIEVSEPEEEELPAKKVGRTKKLTSAGAQGRRISHLSGEESGWEDNNIFQSGAESSSPARPSPVRPRVSRTGAPRKSRKSTSAPPQLPEVSPLRPTMLPEHISRSPPQSPFQPILPAIPKYKFAPPSKLTSVRQFTPAEPIEQEQIGEPIIEEDKTQVQTIEEGYEESESQIDEAIARLESENEAALELPSPVPTRRPTQLFARFLSWFVLLGSAYLAFNYKTESSSIGYCDRGSNTSRALEDVLSRHTALEACSTNRTLSSTNNQDAQKPPCPLPPLIPIPRPASCTTCPDHASCTQFDVTCDSGYILKPHILFSFIPVSPSQSSLTTSHVPQLTEYVFKVISILTDGLPGFGSVAFPPRCVEDPQRKRNIGALGKAIESMLGKERGRRVCHGLSSGIQADLTEAAKWGIEESQLRNVFRKKTAPSLLPVFDDMFTEAIQQLTQWGGVFVSETSDGKRYVAHKTPEMSWDCIITVKSRQLWAAWRTTVLASIIAILATLGVRVRMTQKQKENRRIAGLVQVALDTLRNQELAHYTDPLTVPQPYLSSIQLRDLVLQDEHSVPVRRRLWERVERVVESNANVRANLEELEGGDETRVWRWVGSTGRTPGRKEVDYE
ncbi:hypothetical protein M413DRAFT_438323 [Hebeloma cylindrosporum]|uniref:Man1/Src1 C-terminal domain-containing protein n=1 Tax=Hebeloma cylindrosporum TaxID=76867 RepID=A0A0C3CZA3_HEBCY|nr:hypothetical protein M413DRAFT_438323 [Hebeloma cylindrosporum h7]